MKLYHAMLTQQILRSPVTPSAEHLAKISAATGLEGIDAGSVHIRKVRMANDQPSVDRRLQIKTAALAQMAAMYPGQPVMRNHNTWGSDDLPVARVLDAFTTAEGGKHYLDGHVYFARNAVDDVHISRSEMAIYREMSIAAYFREFECSVCGAPDGDCEHAPGKLYDNVLCTMMLGDPEEVEELSIAWKGRLAFTSMQMSRRKERGAVGVEELLAKRVRVHAHWWDGEPVPRASWW